MKLLRVSRNFFAKMFHLLMTCFSVGNTPVVTGTITQVTKDPQLADIPLSSGVPKHVAPYMDSKDIYKELRLRGYNYK